MKARVLLLMASLLAAAGLSPLTVRATPIDWVVATLEVTQPVVQPVATGGSFSAGSGPSETPSGPSGAPTKGPSLDVDVQGHSIGDRSTLLGTGISFDGLGGADVFDTSDGGFHVKTTKDFGAIDLQVTKKGEHGFGIGSGVGAFGSIHRLSMVVFVPNGVIDSFHVSGTGGTPEVFTGSGSRAIGAADADASGVAVDASVAAAGTSTLDVTSPLGLIGGPAIFECLHCTESWTTPNGGTGTYSETILPIFFLPVPIPVPFPIPLGSISGDDGFVGPAGHWSWTWTGVNVRPQMSETIAAGYAPIGDLWKLFVRGAPQIRVSPKPAAHPSKHKTKVLGEKQTRKTLAATGVGARPAGWLFLAAALGLAAFLRRRPSRALG